MGRPKGSKNKKTIKKEVKELRPKKVCSCCGKEKFVDDFYTSHSVLYKADGRMSICKECTWRLYEQFYEDSKGDSKIAVFRICRLLDDVYLEKPYQSAVTEAQKVNGNIFRFYKKNIASLKQYTAYTFENGDCITDNDLEEHRLECIENDKSDDDKKNEENVIKLIGYDPFESETLEDKKYLFNRISTMLDESVLEDNMLLLSTIEIVKGFNQIDKLNSAIAEQMKDSNKIISNNGAIKTLVGTKADLMKSILKTAEDNGITAKYNTTKSKGSGTLSSLVNKLTEYGIEEAKVNLFDVKTLGSVAQIADASNKNIIEQLNLFNDTDCSDMMEEQRVLIDNLYKKTDVLEEENRLLKLKMKDNGLDYKEFDYLNTNFIDVDYSEEINSNQYAEEVKQIMEKNDKKDKEKNKNDSKGSN